LSVITIAQQEKEPLKLSEEKITLQIAIDTAIINNPNLKVFAYEISSLEKLKIQAGLIPNPEVNFEVEDVFGSNELSGIKGSQYTLSIDKQFELGGKRSKRVALAETEIVSSKDNYELLKLDIIASVKTTFISLYKVQLQIEQQSKFVKLNEEINLTISERVKAGRTSPAEESKVKVTLTNSKIELARLQRYFSSIQTQLNSLMGISGKNLIPITNLFESISAPPTKQEIMGSTEDIPSIKLLQNEVNVRQAKLELEKSIAIPNLTLSGGVRYLNEINSNSFVAGVSIPIPIFNNNNGNIMASEERLHQMNAIKNARKLDVIAQLNTAYNILLSAYHNSLQLKNIIIQEADNAYQITKQGYLQGRFAFIDLLDAQRTLFETQTQYLFEISDYYDSLIEIEKITGKFLIK
jgi:cobalt-zinc-cadmium efflux system outer membrane protein